MYCMKCGAQIPEDCMFCPRCGAQLRPAGPPPEFRPLSNKAKNRRIAIFVLCGCMLLILLMQFFTILMNSDVHFKNYQTGKTGELIQFAPVIMLFILALAGCVGMMCLKKPVASIIFFSLNIYISVFTHPTYEEIWKKQGIDVVRILWIFDLFYFGLALAALILVILNRKTL